MAQKKMKQKQIVIFIFKIVFSILFCVIIYKILTQSVPGLLVTEQSRLLSEDKIVRNLHSRDRGLIITSLSILKRRNDFSGREQARKLLSHQDNHVWLNAALYLASVGDEDSIPYLIKGLSHPAYQSYDEVATYLKALTGKDFGKNQKKWMLWWKENYPQSNFDFSYPEIKKETLRLNDRNYYLINFVVDPVKIRHMGVQIRLIGIKLKEGVSSDRAVTFLKSLVLFQFIQLEFDSGPELDEDGAKRAFVYWVMKEEGMLSYARAELPPVPFKEKTLINGYLLKSGLYEIDLDSVNDNEMRDILIKAVSDL